MARYSFPIRLGLGNLEYAPAAVFRSLGGIARPGRQSSIVPCAAYSAAGAKRRRSASTATERVFRCVGSLVRDRRAYSNPSVAWNTSSTIQAVFEGPKTPGEISR